MALFGNFVGLAYRPSTRFLLSNAALFRRRREVQQAVSLGSWLRAVASCSLYIPGRLWWLHELQRLQVAQPRQRQRPVARGDRRECLWCSRTRRLSMGSFGRTWYETCKRRTALPLWRNIVGRNHRAPSCPGGLVALVYSKPHDTTPQLSTAVLL